MIIRVFLIVAVILLFLWFMGHRSSNRGQAISKMAALALSVLAIIAISAPSSTNRIAHAVGVGRGADLLLYSLTIVFVGYTMAQYVHRQDAQVKTFRLARKLAIVEANLLEHNQKLQKGKN